MNIQKKYESSYAGYIYEKPITYWTSKETITNILTRIDLSSPDSIQSGGMPIISDGNIVYADTSDNHTAIIASSGMKKSLCCFAPLIRVLAKAEENIIITDCKGELYNRLSGFLKDQGYNIYCLDFRTMDKDAFNILSYPSYVYRNVDKDKGLSLLSDIVNALAEDQKNHAKDPFWPATGAQWINATGGIMLDAYPKPEYINIMNWSDFNVRSSAELIEDRLLDNMPDNTIKIALKQSCSSAENTFRSILITASSFFSVFNQNPRLTAMLSNSTFSLENLTMPKTALFLITDDTTSTADPIIGIIISQIQSYLIDAAYHSPKGKLNRRMNFVLDEFASIPVPNMDKALATHRSRNMRYYLCIQSLSLLKKRYGDPELLLPNCSSVMYLGSTELEILQQLEKKLGETNLTFDGKTRPLCSQAELMDLKKTWHQKEAIYMNLSENIRYCTILPSIEKYNIITTPPPTYTTKISGVKTYSVSKFVSDVINEKTRPPFSTKKRTKPRRKKETGCSDEASDGKLEEDFNRLFRTLFNETETE